jgi:hypothetical protein
MKVASTIQLLVVFLAPLAASTAEITVFPQIKLTGANEIAPFIDVPFGSGIAEVMLDYDSSRVNAKWKVCIVTNVLGFAPGLLHIHKAKISENGNARVDFSSLLSANARIFDGCVKVDKDLFNDIKNNPVRD